MNGNVMSRQPIDLPIFRTLCLNEIKARGVFQSRMETAWPNFLEYKTTEISVEEALRKVNTNFFLDKTRRLDSSCPVARVTHTPGSSRRVLEIIQVSIMYMDVCPTQTRVERFWRIYRESSGAKSSIHAS